MKDSYWCLSLRLPPFTTSKGALRGFLGAAGTRAGISTVSALLAGTGSSALPGMREYEVSWQEKTWQEKTWQEKTWQEKTWQEKTWHWTSQMGEKDVRELTRFR